MEGYFRVVIFLDISKAMIEIKISPPIDQMFF